MRQIEISVRHAFRLIPCYPRYVFHGICVIIAKTPFSMWTEDRLFRKKKLNFTPNAQNILPLQEAQERKKVDILQK